MNNVIRFITILKESDRPIPREKLAERLDVHERTVHRLKKSADELFEFFKTHKIETIHDVFNKFGVQ